MPGLNFETGSGSQAQKLTTEDAEDTEAKTIFKNYSSL
jgi:hypothetical protein